MTSIPHALVITRPGQAGGIKHWIRENLFASPLHIFLSLGSISIAAYLSYHIADWLLISATWSGEDRAACKGGGACWPFIFARFNQFIFGFYPAAQQWRVSLVFVMLAVPLAALLFPSMPAKKWIGLFLIAVFPLLAFWLLRGGLGLEVISTTKWGGLTLTLVIATVAIAISLPVGILLALARRSDMVIVRTLAITFIEMTRAVPLVTVLFMASVMLPLFLPSDVSIDKLLRALIGIALFAAAYMAEVVRGGLQAVPDGQYEAAKSLGLGYWRTHGLIILPQALNIAIPSIVNTYIAIFKDTSLVLVIGLFDLLGIIHASITDARWVGSDLEGYAVAAAIYWTFCFTMSQVSLNFERRFKFTH